MKDLGKKDISRNVWLVFQEYSGTQFVFHLSLDCCDKQLLQSITICLSSLSLCARAFSDLQRSGREQEARSGHVAARPHRVGRPALTGGERVEEAGRFGRVRDLQVPQARRQLALWRILVCELHPRRLVGHICRWLSVFAQSTVTVYKICWLESCVHGHTILVVSYCY